MQKKSLITMVLSLALVATIGTGATLAYLSASSNKVTNTFTIGSGYDDGDKAALYVDEEDTAPDAVEDRTTTGNVYKEILPGDTLEKDPTVHFTNGPDSYIFIKVSGMSEDKIGTTTETVFTYRKSALGGAWMKADGTEGLNGVYVYQVSGDYKVKANTELTALFTGVKLNSKVDATEFDKLKNKEEGDDLIKGINDITIQSAAVQFDNVGSVKAAYNLVKDLF